jgi:hypothetical protein
MLAFRGTFDMNWSSGIWFGLCELATYFPEDECSAFLKLGLL